MTAACYYPRMVRVLALVTIASAGCAQLAGIDDTSNEGRGGNSLTVTRLSIGSEVKAAPLDTTGRDANYFIANPNSATGYDRVLATHGDVGRWTADLPEPATVQFPLPDVPAPTMRLFAFPNRELSVLYSVLEHPAPTAAPAGATIALTVENNVPITASDTFQIVTVGAWTVRNIAAAELPVVDGVVKTIGPFTYPYSSSSIISNRGQLDKLTAADSYLVLRYVGALLTGFGAATPFDQTGNDTVNVAIADVAADQMLDVKIDPAKLAMRYTTARPAVSGLVMNWGLNAAPGYLVVQTTGPALRFGGILPTDTGIMAAYGNPFVARKWNTILTVATAETRTFMQPDTMLPVQLAAGMNQFIEPSAGYTIDLPAGLPELISLDGKPLSTDGLSLARPSKFVEVTFVSDADTATFYSVQIFDLLPNAAGTGLEPRLVAAAAADKPSFALPPETFLAGHTYTIRALVTVGGYPKIADGDFTTRSLPLAQSYLDSGVFTVTP